MPAPPSGPWLCSLRFDGRAWCKGFDLDELRDSTHPESAIGGEVRRALIAFDTVTIARTAVRVLLLGQMREDSSFNTLEDGSWVATTREQALARAQALQRRGGCPASAQALAVLEQQTGEWLQLDSCAATVAVVTPRTIVFFFDAG